MGRRTASVLCGVTAALAIALGFTGAAATAATVVAAAASTSDNGGIACGVTNAEYATAPPDCTSGGGSLSV